MQLRISLFLAGLGVAVSATAAPPSAADCYSIAVALSRVEARLEAAQEEAEAAAGRSHEVLASLVELPPSLREPKPSDWSELEALVLGQKEPPPKVASSEEQELTTRIQELPPEALARLTEVGDAASDAVQVVVAGIRVKAAQAARLAELGGCPGARAATRGKPLGGAYPGTVAGQRLRTAFGGELVWADAGAYVNRSPITVALLARAMAQPPELLLRIGMLGDVKTALDAVQVGDPDQRGELCEDLERVERRAGNLPDGWLYRPMTPEEWEGFQATPGLAPADLATGHLLCVLEQH